MISATSSGLGSDEGVQLGQALAVLGPGVLAGVETGRVFLWCARSDGFLAGRLFRAPDAQQVVVELEGQPERPAEARGNGR